VEKKDPKHKLWQSMVNLDLSPDEFIMLKSLGQIRGQSLRQLVSNILRQELVAFSEIITNHAIANQMLPSLEANASRKRLRGRPRINETKIYLKKEKNEGLPASLLDIIDESNKR